MNSELIKVTKQIKTTEGKQTTTSKKSKNKLFQHLVFATIIASLLYCFEFIPNFTQTYLDSEANFYAAKKENSSALQKIKKAAEGTKEYEQYLLVNSAYKNVSSNFKQVKEDEKVYGFDSFQIFAKVLFVTIALFVYVLFNLVRSYRLEKVNIGVRIIHYVMIMYCFFQFFWIFKPLQDFSKPVYYLMTIISTYFVALAVWIYDKQRVKLIQKLQDDRVKLSFYGMRYAKEDKKEEMINVVKQVAKS
jgi:hypothetical protein